MEVETMRIFTSIAQAGLIFCCALRPVFPQTDSTDSRLYFQDLQAVTAILNGNNVTSVDLEDVIKIENGRIIGLFLKNENFTKPLIKNLPGDIGKLTGLRELTLSRNFLKKLPEEIGLLTELRVLKLGENALKTLPESMKNLQKLEVLDLRYNRLSVLPEVCMTLKSLKKLQLWGNQLKTLPDSVGNLENLRELYLQRNQLTALPVCLTQMHNIVYVDFYYNKLCNVSPEIAEWLRKWDARYPSVQFCR
jgi:Leucine-rich repeat (LRR) protein